MLQDLLSRLKKGPVLCDGAMGTLLYAKGVFINKCYDELNLTQPDMVRTIHQEYLNAGAEVIETNTFGGNSFRLMRHGLAEHVHEINLRGAQLSREAADAFNLKMGTDVLVAASVGPLGVRIEPLGKTAREEARESFRQQIAALTEGGVDLIMLETFGYLEELHQAILAAREAAPNLQIVAQVTIDEDGNCLDGASPETFAAKLDEWGADVIGCNCSVGPVAMLEAIERIRRITERPLAAQPNAGIPRSIEGRNIYLCSPEYMASYARKFVTAGVTLVGGCCGTTPEHTRSMNAALRMNNIKGKAPSFRVVSERKRESNITPPPLAQRSTLGRKLASGEFVTMVEIVPPKGIDFRKEVEGAKFLKSAGIDVINIPDSPRASARMSNLALCTLVQQQAGIETVLHFTCRDRNVLSMQSELLGCYTMGMHNLICITGDPPKMGNYPDATAVFDVDAIGLVNIVHNLNFGLDLGGNPIGTGTKFVIGVGANPGIVNIDEEVRRFEYKVEAGAEYAVTQPVFDVRLLEQFLRRIEHHRIPVLAGIWPLTSVRNAEFMKNELRVSVPDSILERMAKAPNAEAARAEGIQIAREMLRQVRGLVQGAQVAAPLGRYSSAIEVLDGIAGTATAVG
ncbi:MAG TPA: bifunctional homocysteine S-methyltransferase/methylenetetrahydrofolate reductase [Candidatus Acidoferrales bacterium]|jgi:methionine synthase I (cobalamin-dependent)/5,10-methylenetetrahydrofolate reductase|nr:bifunctional homocysteine S-methyltransferase/methylenetetrahydrofolate reductase [Candidatus Acidoferrales bacterium]